MWLPNFTRLRYFVAVADTLNFREASEILHVSQPAVSRSVQKLEAELGVKLLDRTTRRVALTAAGSVLADDAKRALQILERSIRRARQLVSGEAGEVILAYSAQAAHSPMADLVVQFQQAHPRVLVSIYQMASDEQQQAMATGQIDVGFMLSAACNPSFCHLHLHRERFVLLAARDHPLTARKSITVDELRDVDFVTGTDRRWKTFLSIINTVCRTAGFEPTVIEEASDEPVLLQLIGQQRGVALYGASITPTLPPDVMAIPVRDPHAAFDIGVAWNGERVSPQVKEFIAFVKATTSDDEARNQID